MRRGPSSHAMLRAIWSTADLEELYETQAWSYIMHGESVTVGRVIVSVERLLNG